MDKLKQKEHWIKTYHSFPLFKVKTNFSELISEEEVIWTYQYFDNDFYILRICWNKKQALILILKKHRNFKAMIQ